MVDAATLERYIREAALERGIDPDIAVKVARSEGLKDGVWQSNVVNDGMRETSYGPFQLLMGGGLGDKFVKKYGKDPRDKSTVYDQIDFALDEASAGGWGPWYGAAKVGVDKWDGLKGSKASGRNANLSGSGSSPSLIGGALDDKLGISPPRRWRKANFDPVGGGSKHDYSPFNEKTGTGQFRTKSGKVFEFDAAGNSWRVDPRKPIGSRKLNPFSRKRVTNALDDGGYLKSHRYGENSAEELRDHYERQLELEASGRPIGDAGRMTRAADTETRRFAQTKLTPVYKSKAPAKQDEEILDEARTIIRERPHLDQQVREKLREQGINPDLL